MPGPAGNAHSMPLAVCSELGGTDSSGSFNLASVSSPSPYGILQHVVTT